MKIKILIIIIASVFVAITCCSCTHKESGEKEQATTECIGCEREKIGTNCALVDATADTFIIIADRYGNIDYLDTVKANCNLKICYRQKVNGYNVCLHQVYTDTWHCVSILTLYKGGIYYYSDTIFAERDFAQDHVFMAECPNLQYWELEIDSIPTSDFYRSNSASYGMSISVQNQIYLKDVDFDGVQELLVLCNGTGQRGFQRYKALKVGDGGIIPMVKPFDEIYDDTFTHFYGLYRMIGQYGSVGWANNVYDLFKVNFKTGIAKLYETWYETPTYNLGEDVDMQTLIYYWEDGEKRLLNTVPHSIMEEIGLRFSECRGSSHETSGCDASIIRNGYWYRDDVYQVRDDVLQLFDALNSYDWYCMSLDSNICETRGYIERLCRFYDKHIHEVNNISDHEKADAAINRIVQYYIESQKEDNSNMGEIVSAAVYGQLSTLKEYISFVFLMDMCKNDIQRLVLMEEMEAWRVFRNKFHDFASNCIDMEYFGGSVAALKISETRYKVSDLHAEMYENEIMCVEGKGRVASAVPVSSAKSRLGKNCDIALIECPIDSDFLREEFSEREIELYDDIYREAKEYNTELKPLIVRWMKKHEAWAKEMIPEERQFVSESSAFALLSGLSDIICDIYE